jgi:RNA polymerase sigma-70 factor (ECF subfamily)
MPLDVALSRLRCFINRTSGFENLAGRLNKAPDSAHLMTEMAARGATVEELESLYRADLPRFVRAATAIVGDEGAGRDAVQDAFVQAVRKRTGYKDEAPLQTWVWRIVINEALALRRRRASEFERVSESETTRSTNHVPEQDAAVRAWVAALPERQRLAVFLRYFADLDYQSIAVALEVEVGTVSATLATAHAALRRSYGEAVR